MRRRFEKSLLVWAVLSIWEARVCHHGRPRCLTNGHNSSVYECSLEQKLDARRRITRVGGEGSGTLQQNVCHPIGWLWST